MSALGISMLTLTNVSCKIGTNLIVRAVSLKVKHGEIAVLLGGSGVGKSTLLRVLNNLAPLSNGSITLDGKPLDLKNVNKAHTVGLIFQQFNLFEHLSVIENITIVLDQVMKIPKQEAHAQAMTLLKSYGLAEKASMPVSRLSGGQRQRLALSRALAVQPKVLCADEPTSALDPLLTAHVARSFEKLAAQNLIVLIATHDVSLIEQLNCTIHLMEQGTIVESSTSTAYKENPTQYPLLRKFLEATEE